MNYWWVNHKQTFKQETGGNYIWSPVTNRNGSRNRFYENMPRVRPGDLVVSYANAAIRALGIATGPAALMPRPPEFGKTGEAWTNEGWKIPVQFCLLATPVRPSLHMNVLAPTLPSKYSPIQADGYGNQGAYLSEVNAAMAAALRELVGAEWEAAETNRVVSAIEAHDTQDRDVEGEILQRTDIGETQRAQLVNARRGQGVYRKNLEAFESKCRITGLTEVRHLRASHIKPWRACTDFEKLDGNNGLLLSPHVDYLFDQGFISFGDEGNLMISPGLAKSLLEAWRIPPCLDCGPFGPAQRQYLPVECRRKYSRSVPMGPLEFPGAVPATVRCARPNCAGPGLPESRSVARRLTITPTGYLRWRKSQSIVCFSTHGSVRSRSF